MRRRDALKLLACSPFVPSVLVPTHKIVLFPHQTEVLQELLEKEPYTKTINVDLGNQTSRDSLHFYMWVKDRYIPLERLS